MFFKSLKQIFLNWVPVTFHVKNSECVPVHQHQSLQNIQKSPKFNLDMNWPNYEMNPN